MYTGGRHAVCFLSQLFAVFCFFFSSRRRHTRLVSDWSSDVCSSDLGAGGPARHLRRLLSALAGHRALGHHQSCLRHLSRALERQIGRASCRERGEIPEGGGTLEKKKE